MKLTLIITLLCCFHEASGGPITNLALQEYWINRQMAQNRLPKAGRHRQQTLVPGQAMEFEELLQLIKTAQMVADSRRRCQNRCSQNCRQFGPKVAQCNRGTMHQFRRMKNARLESYLNKTRSLMGLK